jgi:hypothetical protein
MWGELFREGSALEIVQMLLLAAGMGLVLMIPLVWIAGKIVALKERPGKRALWTTAVAYGVVALVFIIWGGDFISPLLGPIVPLPGAIVVFLWLRSTYRKGWIEDDEVSEGTKLENSDWRVGVGVVAGVIVAAAIKAAFVQ